MTSSRNSVASPEVRIRVGVSSCLLGRRVRYDGGHKRMDYLTDVLGAHVEWVPVCPEVELGLGTPRHPIILTDADDDIRFVMPTTGADHTDAMRTYAARRTRELAAEDLAGYVLKSKSPSCGPADVPIHSESHGPPGGGRGLFAAELIRSWPNLPIEDEARLMIDDVRASFIERVFAYARLKSLFNSRWRLSNLIDFHTAHKLSLMAHSPGLCRAAGRVLARAHGIPRGRVRSEYESRFMSCLATPSSVEGHTNALHHVLGYFDSRIDEGARRELLAAIEDYRTERVPLSVPLGLARNYARRLEINYLKGQVYIFPHAEELDLLKHV